MWLNDRIVDFYLLFMSLQLSVSTREDIYIYPTTFYKRMTLLNLNVAQGLHLPGRSEAEVKAMGVKRWTKDLNIFEKKILLIPVCESKSRHWFLIAVIFPGCEGSKETVVVILDSLEGCRDEVVENIKDYLNFMHGDENAIGFANSDLRVVHPLCPQQDDLTSCGIFMLHFAEKIIYR